MAKLPFLITLSPAKKFHALDFQTHHSHSAPIFLDKADMLASKLKNLSAIELAETMDISPAIAKLNYTRYQSYQPHQTSQGYPACSLFAGDAFKTLDFCSFSPHEKDNAQTHLVILSGLYGFLRPLDLIQPYRLEMGSRLRQFLKHDLYDYWRTDLTQWLSNYIAEHAIHYHINLASQEYAKVIDTSLLPCPTLNIIFADSSDTGYRVIGIKAKRARGLMARFILTQAPQTISDLKSFNVGYQFSEAHSNERQFVFISTA